MKRSEDEWRGEEKRRLEERKRAVENVMIKKKRGDVKRKRRDVIGN